MSHISPGWWVGAPAIARAMTLASARRANGSYDMNRVATASGAVEAFEWGAGPSSSALADTDEDGK